MSGPEGTYLGDGVYAHFDGYMICLVVDRGSSNERRVWLEPGVYAALARYAAKVWPDDDDPR